MRSFLDSVRVGQRKSVEGRGERGNELSRVGIMRSGVFKSIRREIKNSVCVWGQGGGVRMQKGEVRKRGGGDGREM